MSTQSINVWVDTDTSIGVQGADVDDGLALIQTFHSPELHLRGVSSVFGNAPIESTQAQASEVVERFGPVGMEVHLGAGSSAERGASCPAVDALASALEEAPLHIMAIGPVTNVASLLLLHPELASKIQSIVMVAARRPGQSFLSHPNQPIPFPDLNFDCDPGAMQNLLDSSVPLVFAPWEVSSHVWLKAEDLDQLERAGGAGAYIAEHSRSWLANWTDGLLAPGFNPFDTLAIAALTHPQWLEGFRCGVWIEEGPDDLAGEDEKRRGATKPHLLVDAESTQSKREALYYFRPDAQFKPMLLERLAGPSLT